LQEKHVALLNANTPSIGNFAFTLSVYALLSPQRNHPIAMPAVESPILFFSLDIDNHFGFRFLNIA
jgi:hypothetical protein